MRHIACGHATFLELERLEGRAPTPADDSGEAALLQSRGDAHEAGYLASLRTQGRSVVEVDADNVDFETAIALTRQALSEAPDIIFQGALRGGAWGGYSDFLEKVDRPSALGDYSYEVVDTKLKRKATPGHAMQIALYSDLLAELQGVSPEWGHVELGDGQRETIRLSEISAYARGARADLEEFVVNPAQTRPQPCSACPLCRWRDHCAVTWKEEDSLFRVAGISRSQVEKLERAGVSTMAALARRSESVPRLASETLSKLVLQARLQHARKTGGPTYALRPHAAGKGFDLLPQPVEGDLFYDIEGDPFYSEGGSEGLEYLHGVWDGHKFTALWAHDHAEESSALARLFSLFEKQIERFPKARIYHYAPYEITALRRLCTRYGQGEAVLDRWLREDRFVDLYGVVRGGVVASEPSYSIKDMEAFYDISREGEVKTAGGSVVAYEEWRLTNDQHILDEIEDYNRIDCVSTEKLRDWLVGIRPDAATWSELAGDQSETTLERDEHAEEIANLLTSADMPDERRRLLYDLAMYHRREAKPAAWAVFDAAGKDFDDLADDLDCIVGLSAIEPAEDDGRMRRRAYQYPYQETKLRAGATVSFDAGELGIRQATIDELDRRLQRLALRFSKSIGEPPDSLDLLPSFAVNTKTIEEAIENILRAECGGSAKPVSTELLSRSPPRFRGLAPSLGNDDPVTSLIAAVNAMDKTVLPVQGPPGTGKTYVTARAILALVRNGKRVGVSSNSHEAVRNVLMACVDALNDHAEDLNLDDVEIAHKDKTKFEPNPPPYDAIRQTRNANDAAHRRANIVGGTAWLFAREDLADAFDYIFIDEAGQVPLANALAMTRATANLVLVGDPRQLPQVSQGAHPYPANLSCLDWMLGDQTVVSSERGLFLAETRRLHPELCRYVSDQFYTGALRSHPTTANQAIAAPGLPTAGAYLQALAHEGRTQESPEEIEAISKTIKKLLKGQWTDQAGETRPLTPSDIIVVAPYNAQVNALTDELPGIRVGTVDKFQGQEAPVALVSMTASSAAETTRGIDFLLSRERLNVAVSRAKALSIVFASPRLTRTPCSTIGQVRLVNALCALLRLETAAK